VFLGQNFVLIGQKIPLNENVKEEYLLKSCYFTAIGWSSMKTVADRTHLLLIITSSDDELFKGINIDDLERL